MPRESPPLPDPLQHSRFQAVLGVELAETHADGATMSLRVEEKHLNVAGVVHGGVTFALADSSIGYAIHSVVRRRSTTAEMKINYLRPVVGGVMLSRSRILRRGRTLVVAKAEVSCDGTMVAEALATFALLD